VFVFIDADLDNLIDYVHLTLHMIRTAGVMIKSGYLPRVFRV